MSVIRMSVRYLQRVCSRTLHRTSVPLKKHYAVAAAAVILSREACDISLNGMRNNRFTLVVIETCSIAIIALFIFTVVFSFRTRVRMAYGHKNVVHVDRNSSICTTRKMDLDFYAKSMMPNSLRSLNLFTFYRVCIAKLDSTPSQHLKNRTYVFLFFNAFFEHCSLTSQENCLVVKLTKIIYVINLKKHRLP